MIEVVPALLPTDLHTVQKELSRVTHLVKRVQIDIVDGEYAPTKTWPFNIKNNDDVLNMVRNNINFPFSDYFVMELDMLVLHPIEYIPDFLSLGFKSFVIHIDSTDHVKECIETIKNAGCMVGIGIKPSIDSNLIEEHIEKIDFVQFMGNDMVGFSGVELDFKLLEKIKNFKKLHPEINTQVDIGVNFDTAPLLIKSGLSAIVSNSTIFNSKDPKQAIMRLQNS